MRHTTIHGGVGHEVGGMAEFLGESIMLLRSRKPMVGRRSSNDLR